jgi:hypothetical protein
VIIKLLMSVFILISCNDIINRLRYGKHNHLLLLSASIVLTVMLFLISASYKSLLPLYTLVWLALLGIVIWLSRGVAAEG